MVPRPCLPTAIGWLVLMLASGCGGTTDRQPTGPKPRATPHPQTVTTRKPKEVSKVPRPAGPSATRPDGGKTDTTRPTASDMSAPSRRENSLADLLSGNPTAWAEQPGPEEDPHDAVGRMVPQVPRMKIDDARVRQSGIRKLHGKHLTLYTDLPPDAEVDALPEVFDQAFPQWCRYFNVPPAKHDDWRLTGVLMKDKERFKRAGLLPEDLPPFPHGYARNYEFWLYEQPSAYYRRHLLLHEGTHGFMNTLLGSCGPPWYMEGIAELLATHRWAGGRLKMDVFPATRDEVPMWGRIKIVRDAFADLSGKRLDEVVHYSATAHRQNEPYGWCWAAAAFLQRHPRYRERFTKLTGLVGQRDFSKQFFQMYRDDWDRLCVEWELFVAGLDYGYDVERMAVDFAPGEPLPTGGTEVTIRADRGWQSSRIELEKGRAYRITAAGRYQVADRPRIWWCEPGGVSIRYVNGQPLGILLAAVWTGKYRLDRPSPLVRPAAVGLAETLVPQESGTLYLRINDAPNELADNAGTLTVRVVPVDPKNP